LGSEIATLVNEEKQIGNYTVEFSAIGGSASGGDATALPSGIYFYQLHAGDPSTSLPAACLSVGRDVVDEVKSFLNCSLQIPS